MNLKQVEAFRAAMITGKVIEAAKLLYVSQPSVTRLLQELEDELGYTLFKRSKTGIVPTAEALQFYEAVKLSFIGLDSLEKTAKQIGSLQSGKLRIASLVAMSFGFIPHVVRVFQESYPHIQISLTTGQSCDIINSAPLQRYDVGIVIKSKAVASGIVEPFIHAKAVIIVPLDHPLAKKMKIIPQDLQGENFIMLDPGDSSRQKLEALLLREGITVKPVIEALYSASICGFVSQSVGIALVNPFTAHYFQSMGYHIKPFEPAIQFENKLIFPENQPRSLACQAFVKILHQCKNEIIEKWNL